MDAVVTHLHRSPTHEFSKSPERSLVLIAGMGVDGDAHYGATVRHRSRVALDPSQPNLRQVHLLQGELVDELVAQGFELGPGDLGENITTRGIDLPALPVGTVLRIGDAFLGMTGLRNPCKQIEAFRPGMLRRVVDQTGQGHHRAGAMAVVLRGGTVEVGQPILWSSPPGEPVAMVRV